MDSTGAVQLARTTTTIGTSLTVDNGVTVASGGLAVTGSGVLVGAGGVFSNGNTLISAGAISLTNAAASAAAVLDIASTAGAGNANILNGYIPAAGTGNLMLLSEGSNQLFKVMSLTWLVFDLHQRD